MLWCHNGGISFMKTLLPLSFCAFFLTVAIAAFASEPEVHIKTRFIEVTKESLALLKPFPELTNGVRILSSVSFKKLLQSLELSSGNETLAEPEVVTTGGRQIQMRGTTME